MLSGALFHSLVACPMNEFQVLGSRNFSWVTPLVTLPLADCFIFSILIWHSSHHLKNRTFNDPANLAHASNALLFKSPMWTGLKKCEMFSSIFE